MAGEGSKRFFFEKKKQKTFILVGVGGGRGKLRREFVLILKRKYATTLGSGFARWSAEEKLLFWEGLRCSAGARCWRRPGPACRACRRRRTEPTGWGPEDQLNIRIYNQPQLSGSFTIDDSGMIDLPLLGPVQASGLTTSALESEITEGLQREKLILQPSVAVEVSTYRPFYILGEVNTPGQYAFRPNMTMLTAVSIAGGFTYRAVQAYAGVTRDTGARPVQYRAPLFALAQPGDVITIYERNF
jgi:polysaccharide biosynthesis/export protein